MKEGRASRTAELMAFFRAVESSRPVGVRLFRDPFAAAFLSLPLRAALAVCRTSVGRAAVVGIVERRWGGPLGSAVCRTAELMAFFRAVESSRPAGARLFRDPFAAAFLSLPLRAALAVCRTSVGRAAVVGIIERQWGGPLGSAVCRTRWIDDVLSAALREGVPQVVVLGAGFDCRAHRIPGIERARVFEVDHPATQAAKRAILGAAPARVVYVPVDFDRDDLDAAMARAGFDPRTRTFFLWEGVTNYLMADAVDATLRWIARVGAAGSALVMTYVHRGLIDGSVAFDGARAGSATVRRFGEPYTFGFDPAELPGYLAARDLTLVEDVSADDYRSRYLAPAGREMKLWDFYRAALARVS